MIGRLQGRLLEKQPPYLLLDVQGVGYELLAPMITFYQLPALGETVTLHTQFIVSEAAQQLFGFYQLQDRALFRQLIKVSGVGPKLALAILSALDTPECVHAIRSNNLQALVKVPGVGRKIAERLLIELRDSLKDWVTNGPAAGPSASPSPPANNTLGEEAQSALEALGHQPAEAAKAIAATLKQHAPSRSEELIRLVLRSMMPAGDKRAP